MIGPKALPILAVPKGWTRNRATRIATAAGSTQGWNDGATMFSPSRADRTEMAGVTAPSP